MQRIQSIMKTLVMASTALLLATSGIAHAVVPIKLVVGFSAGSSSDMLARVLAFELEKTLGQPVIVDNRPGASSIIAAEYVARAAPDGNTLLLASNTALVANQYLFKELRYDAAKDLTPIARLTTVPTFLVVGNKVPAQDLKGLIELGKKPASNLFYAYGNSTGQVAGATFARLAQIKTTAVPYKSTPPAVTDVIAGNVQFMFVDLTARALINAGSIRAIGVASPQASSLMPSVPPISAAPGLGTFEMASWHGIHGPANMAPALVDKLHAAFNKALTSPSVIEKFKEVGAEPVSMTLPEYTEFFRQQQQQWKDRISEAGIEPQ